MIIARTFLKIKHLVHDAYRALRTSPPPAAPAFQRMVLVNRAGHVVPMAVAQ